MKGSPSPRVSAKRTQVEVVCPGRAPFPKDVHQEAKGRGQDSWGGKGGFKIAHARRHSQAMFGGKARS